MEILKYYSIILVGIGVFINLYSSIKNKSNDKFLSFLFLFPLLVYLILTR